MSNITTLELVYMLEYMEMFSPVRKTLVPEHVQRITVSIEVSQGDESTRFPGKDAIRNGRMQTLWTPWRMKYMMDHEKSAECVFCRAVRQVDGAENLVVLRGETAFVILNRYPYTSGHIMVVPFEHEPSFENLNASTRAEIMELMNTMIIHLRAIYGAPAFNIGANIGEAAGAGIASHVHLHVVPRWAGDNNFMATIGETRVLPEALPDSYRRIRRQLEKAGLVDPH